MKKIILSLFVLIGSIELNAQNVSINQGGAAPDHTAMLDISSTSSGLLIPRMTFLQRTLILLPANSLLIYQTNSSPGYYYNSGTPLLPVWVKLATNPDNLGDHIATENIQLNRFYLSNDGDDEGILIDNTGDVGIGLRAPNAPNARLHVQDSVSASNTNGAFIDIQNKAANAYSLSGLRFKNSLTTSNTRYQAAIWHRFDNSATDFQLNFAVRDNSVGTNVDTADIKMTINNNGQVGIGTTTPKANLHVSSRALSTTTLESSNANGSWLALGNSSVGGKYYQLISTGSSNSEGAGKLLFAYGNTANFVTGVAMTLVDNQVGIGTTAPSATLDVVGDIEIPAANAYTYATPKTHYASIPPSAFVSVRPESYELNALGVIIYISIGGSSGTIGWASAPINNIPNGARIVNVTYVYYDNDILEQATFGIQRVNNLASTSSGYALFNTGVVNASAAYQTNTTNVGLVLDYENAYYNVYFAGIQGNTNLRLKNVIIEYTVTEAD